MIVTYFLLIAFAISVAITLFIVIMFVWHHFRTKGMAYFGKSQAERARFKKRLARYDRFLRPLLRPIGSALSDPNQFASEYEGIYVPSNSCSQDSFQRAVEYAPRPNDVFVVAQMKCGTTWMQQLVYEVLSRGQGDLSDGGHGPLAAVAPWLEAYNGVSLDEAPLIGASRAKIIKTHLPASLCPYDDTAKYIYVTRHPVSCYRSCVDFFQALSGPLTPPREALLAWFCSDRMWWGSWPNHVEGYWQWAQRRSNVLFFHFEDLKRDLTPVIREVAQFLDCDLTRGERSAVADKCSFSYMKSHEAQFEMIPPSFFSANETFFKSGSIQRHADVEATQKERILAFCRESLTEATYPVARFYPDVKADGRWKTV